MRKRILYFFLVFGLLLPAASDVQGRTAAYTATEQKDATVYITKPGRVTTSDHTSIAIFPTATFV